MISAWWLLLIIPVTYIAGYITCAFMIEAKEGKSDDSDKK